MAERDFGSKPAVEKTKPKKAEIKEIASRVESITRRLRNKMVFHLANDQIWVQTSNKHVTIREGDKVFVRKLRLGAYVLVNERGASTRVTRVD